MFYERSAVAEADRQLLRDFHQTIAQKEDDARITTSEIYQNCDVAVIFGSWKRLSKITRRGAFENEERIGFICKHKTNVHF